MATYFVEVKDSSCYVVNAATPEQARQQAWEWFIEREPAFEVREVNPSCSNCVHDDPTAPNSFASCNCCDNKDLFWPTDEVIDQGVLVGT